MGMPQIVDRATQYELFTDWFNLDTVAWTSVDDGTTGTNTANATPGGEISVVTAGADNDIHCLKSTAAVFKFAANKPLWFEARFSLTEAATNAANIVFGVSSVVDATILGDNGAGPPANYSGALFFKVDGVMSLQFETSNATVQVTNASLLTFVSGRTYRVGFAFDPADGTTGVVRPYVVDETAGTITNVAAGRDLGHKIALASLASMNAIFGCKAGGANAETLKVDYVRVVAAR